MPADLLESILDETTSAEPPVSPIADKMESEDIFNESSDGNVANEPSTESGTGTTSSIPPQSGETFNPEIHQTDAAGNPVRRKDGQYAKKRGRKLGTQNVTATRVDGTQPPNDEMARAAAFQTVQAIFLLGSIVGGEEFGPIVNKEMGYDETKVMVDAWTAFYITSDMRAIPPWVGVALATTSYVAIRMTMPKTQTRLATFWGWISRKIWGEKSELEK